MITRSLPVSNMSKLSSLMFLKSDDMVFDSGCSYLDPEGTLHGRLEARLARPEAECIIC